MCWGADFFRIFLDTMRDFVDFKEPLGNAIRKVLD